MNSFLTEKHMSKRETSAEITKDKTLSSDIDEHQPSLEKSPADNEEIKEVSDSNASQQEAGYFDLDPSLDPSKIPEYM